MANPPKRTRNRVMGATTGTTTVFLFSFFAPAHEVVLQRYGFPSKLPSKQMIYVKVGKKNWFLET